MASDLHKYDYLQLKVKVNSGINLSDVRGIHINSFFFNICLCDEYACALTSFQP